MGLQYNGTNVSSLQYNNTNVNKLFYNDVIAWCRQFTYTTGTLPTGVASLTCTRYSSDNPGTGTGTVANNGAIFYDDKIYWTATASTGYNVSLTYGSTSSLYTVKGNVTGVSTAGVTTSVKSYTLTLTNNMGHGAIACYRNSSPLKGASTGSSATLTNGSTIYHGDTIYIKAVPAVGYSAPTITSSTGLTIFSNNVASSVDGNETITIGTNDVLSYTLTLNKTNADGATVTCYRNESSLKGATTGSGATLSNGSTIYYGDKIYCGASTKTGYENPSISSSTGLTFVNNISSGIDGNETINVNYQPNSYTLTVETNYSSGLSPTVNCFRYSTKRSGASTGSSATLSNGSTIYYDDVIYSNITVSGGAAGVSTSTGTFTTVSGNQALTVNGNETIKFVAKKSYTLTISKVNQARIESVTCYRYSSQVPGVATGTSAALVNGSTIYEGDVIYIKATGGAAWYSPTVTSSTGTISSNKLTVDGNETITITGGELRHYTLTLNKYNMNMAQTVCYREYYVNSQGEPTPGAGNSGGQLYQENITNGSTIYYGDTIYVGVGVTDSDAGYGSTEIVSPTTTLTSASSALTGGKKVSNVTGDVTINVVNQPKAYTLTVNGSSYAACNLSRYFSLYKVVNPDGTVTNMTTVSDPGSGLQSTYILTNNSTIYFGDTIKYSLTPSMRLWRRYFILNWINIYKWRFNWS